MGVMIIDLNQIMIANLMVELTRNKRVTTGADVEEGLLRHMIINQIRGLRKKFKSEYHDVVIACDDKNYWRKNLFPYYKANRAKTRNESLLDWNLLFTHLNKIRDEMKVNFPYHIIQIETAEADDIIASIVMNSGLGEELMVGDILIVSGDKDFSQLQKYGLHIKQYDPTRKKWINTDTPHEFLFEHLVRGDVSDGVPNIRSKDDVFVTEGTRQLPVTAKMMKEWMLKDPKEFCDEEMLKNWKRNNQLINLDNVPENIQSQVVSIMKNPVKLDRGDLLDYFISSNLNNLIEDIGDF